MISFVIISKQRHRILGVPSSKARDGKIKIKIRIKIKINYILDQWLAYFKIPPFLRLSGHKAKAPPS
jgi:hypothetical protein